MGLRYTVDHKGINQNLVVSSLDPDFGGATFFSFMANEARYYHGTTPKFGIDYQITPRILAYGSVTKGYKSGGTNFASFSQDTLFFNPETIWSYEVGLKSEFFDRKLRFNASAFYYDYKNLQVIQLITATEVSIGNAATATDKGLEFEAAAKPIPGLTLSANVSLLDATYDTFSNASVPNALVPFVTGNSRYNATANSFNASGNNLDSAPKSSFSLEGEYDWQLGPGRPFIDAEYFHQERSYFDPSNNPILSQPGYHLVNASVGYDFDPTLRLAVIGKNLTYSHYLISATANGVVPSGLVGAPRQVIVQLTKKW